MDFDGDLFLSYSPAILQFKAGAILNPAICAKAISAPLDSC